MKTSYIILNKLRLSQKTIYFALQSKKRKYKMKDKDKALEQLDNIHSYMVDSEDKTPYDSNIILLWALASAVMFLSFEIVLGFGVYYAIFFVIGVSALASGVGFFMTRRENYKYDIAKMTHNQTIMNYDYIIAIGFAIILTMVFNQNDIGSYSYPTWVFLIGFVNLNAGLILNKACFRLAGMFGLVVGALMFGGFLYFGVDYLSHYDRYISTIVCSGSLVYIAMMLKRA